jgi:hypothetical protein
MIDPIYLPFTREELRPHFTTDADANIDYFERSIRRYHEFLEQYQDTLGQSGLGSGIPKNRPVNS